MSPPPPPPPAAHPGTLHRYASRLVAFEHPSPHAVDAAGPAHTLLWIGGLGDGLLTVSYPTAVARALPAPWTLAQVLLSSAYSGWGTHDLADDARDLARCVAYFRAARPRAKLVVMGHSTGCQDILHYLTGCAGLKAGADAASVSRPPVDGAVLQAPASDREALGLALSRGALDESVELACAWERDGRGDDVLPRGATRGIFGPAPVSARRWLSLASPDHDGADDMFSSDLPDARLARSFGALPAQLPLMFLYSGADEHVPPAIDKEALLERWAGFARRAGGFVGTDLGGVVPRAHHNLERDPDDVVADLVRRVVTFVAKVERDEYARDARL